MTWFMISSFLLFNLFLGVSQAQTNQPTKSRSLLLVVNQGDQSMSLVDPEAGVQIGKVKTNEVRAHEVTASPDGRLAYLPIYGNSGVGKPGTDGASVEIVDLDKQAIVGSIAVGAVRPHWVKFGPDGMLYVSAELDQAIDVLDPRQQKKVASIPTGQPESHMVVMSHDGHRAYTANVDAGTVSVLDLDARKTIKVIHTIVWGFFASCIVAIPVFALRAQYSLAALLIQSEKIQAASVAVPKKTAAKAGKSRPGPESTLKVPTFMAKITPAMPAIPAEATREA